jgi:hypothetical protein
MIQTRRPTRFTGNGSADPSTLAASQASAAALPPLPRAAAPLHAPLKKTFTAPSGAGGEYVQLRLEPIVGAMSISCMRGGYGHGSAFDSRLSADSGVRRLRFAAIT